MATKNIMIVGVGGQGTLLTSRILGGLALAGGYDVKLSEVHGMAQRGGSVVTYVRYGEKVAEPIVEEGQADVIIAFEKLEALRYAHFLKKDGALIVNDWRIDPMPVVIGAAEYPENILENLKKDHKVYTVLLYFTPHHVFGSLYGFAYTTPTPLVPVFPFPARAFHMRPYSSDNTWYRNLNLLSIAYVLRPVLRPRLTQSRSALLWKP